MFIDYIVLGLISLATLVWAFYTLPGHGASSDDGDGGLHVEGDSAPTDAPPTLAQPTDDGRVPAKS